MSKIHTGEKSTETTASHHVTEETPGPTQTPEKKKYSSKLSRNLQLLEKGHAKAGKRLAEAVATGFGVWIEEREASAAKRRDGAVKDFAKNASKALRKALKEGAEAPADILDSVAKMKIRARL
jgi:hypothetical protein